MISIFIVFDNKKPIGYCLGRIRKNIPIFSLKKYGYVDDLYVEKEYRGKGLGQKLLNEAKRFFKSKKLKFMELKSNHNNYKSIKFYKKYGFKEYAKIMRIRI